MGQCTATPPKRPRNPNDDRPDHGYLIAHGNGRRTAVVDAPQDMGISSPVWRDLLAYSCWSLVHFVAVVSLISAMAL
jgi:hypothetical protein